MGHSGRANRGLVDPHNEGLHKTDFTVYTEAGAAFFDGRDPYTVTNPRGWGYLYLPLFAMLMAPLHALPPEWQVTVWFFLSLATLAGCYFETARLARLCFADDERPLSECLPVWLIGAAVAAAALPAFNCLQRGQIGLLKLYLLLLGLRLALEARGRWRSFAAGLVLAMSIGLKLTPALPVGFLWCQQLLTNRRHRDAAPRRSWALAGISGTLVGLIVWIWLAPAALVGWQANLRHLGDWWELVGDKSQRQTYDRFAGDSTRCEIKASPMPCIIWAIGPLTNLLAARTTNLSKTNRPSSPILSRTDRCSKTCCAARSWPLSAWLGCWHYAVPESTSHCS